jgi:hypothetical protein
MKKCNYDEKIMQDKMPFKIKDLLFSSILYLANKYLIKIIDILETREKEGETRNSQEKKEENKINEYKKSKEEILEWIARTERNYYRYFLPPHHSKFGEKELSLFLDYDLVPKD